MLRQITPGIARERVHLFVPDDAVRVRRNVNADTPFPPEVPHAENPPDGAVIYYSLASKPSSPVTLDVYDGTGALVRHMSSVPDAPVKEAAQPPEPNWWLAPPYALPANAGTNRAVWDLRYDAPPAFTHSFEINANPGETPPSPEAPMALPGTYTVKLTVDGRTYTQHVTVSNDPRSPASLADLRAQHALQMQYYTGAQTTWDAYQRVEAMRRAIEPYTHGSGPSDVTAAADSLDAKLAAIAGSTERGRGFGTGGAQQSPSFVALNGTMTQALTNLENGDMAPNAPMQAAYATACSDLATAIAALRDVETRDVAAFNALLTKNSARPVSVSTPVQAPSCGATASGATRRAGVGGRS